jgi:aryl-alcohol dehydrogenase-like predicted oxidoreductase
MNYCVDVDVGSVEQAGADGVSVYSVEEAATVLDLHYDMVQVPSSILDGRMDGMIPKLQRRGMRVAVRSGLLQGLLASEPGEMPAGNVGNSSFVKSAWAYLTGLRGIGARYGMGVVEMAVRWMYYVRPDIVIIGCEHSEQARHIGNYFLKGTLPNDLVDDVLELREGIPEVVISPRTWGQRYDFTLTTEKK